MCEKGFDFIAVEGDWPDCFRVNRWLKGEGGGSALSVLRCFDRWPTWMWANAEVAEFLEWLRSENLRRAQPRRVGFYGMDVYSLWASMRVVLDYLRHGQRRAAGTGAPRPDDVVIVGFTGHHGSVIARLAWGAAWGA